MERIRKDAFLTWTKAQLPLLLLVAVSAFFHFYLFASRLHFLGDEATHAQTVADMLHGNIPTVGPSASAGNGLYHGAFYYYLLFIPGLLSGFSPLGFAGFTALLSIASLVLLHEAARIFYGRRAAFLAGFLYAVSFNVNHFSRWAWNPNLIPFFMALALWSLALLFTKKDGRYLAVFAFSLAAMSQLHISSVLFFGVLLLMLPLLLQAAPRWRDRGYALLAFLLPLLPTLYHEVRHRFPSVHAISSTVNGQATSATPFDRLSNGVDFIKYFYSEVIRIDPVLPLAFGIGILAWQLWSKRGSAQGAVALFLLLTLAGSLVCFGYYPETVQVHFSEHLFPVFALITGLVLAWLTETPAGYAGLAIVLYVASFNNIQKFDQVTAQGERDYPTEQAICASISGRGIAKASVSLNGQANPNFLEYVCKNQYGLELQAGAPAFTVTSDFEAGTYSIR